ncbi:hypothetical protein [Rufibacter roseolus]|uniref:hypothetical protein n=1 Tax=Rufibacter roseolus TaxID=2817375 RepID=UPI001B302EDB|nr:hypothetical protein [Rufibacter roseolus]
MSRSYILLLAFLVLAFSSCSDGSSKAETTVGNSKENPAISLDKESGEQAFQDGLQSLLAIKKKISKGNYKQVEDFISQVNSSISKDSVRMTTEERLSFPQPSKEILVDFLKSINSDSLRATKRFEKKYSFGSAPKGYNPDSSGCPDGLTLTFDENTQEFTLSIANRFLVDADIGCVESMTIYYLTAEKERIRLKRLEYAG